MRPDLIDLIDIERTQRLLQDFMDAGGIPAAIIDLKGVVLVTSRWRRVCTDFHRVNETRCGRCIESDTVLANELLEGKTFSLYRCQNGLTDAASPIIIEGEHIANAFIGQFFIEKPDLEFFRRQAKEFGFDESAYLRALSEIRVVPENTLPAVLSFLTSFAEMIASLGLKQLEQLESAKELRKAQHKLETQYRKLRESEEDLNRAQAVAHIGSWRVDSQRNVLHWSDETYRMFGVPKGVPMTYEAFLAIVHPEDRELVDRSWQAALGGAAYDLEHRILVGDILKWVHEQAELELDEQGALRGGFGTVQDITERKRTEAIMRVRLNLLEFATSHSTEELLQKTLDEISDLTSSSIGFLHFVADNQKTLLLQAWSTRTLREFCSAGGKGMHYPIEQAGVWVDCVHEKRPVIHNDYSSLPHRKGIPEGHPAVLREVVVPIMRPGKVVAILGIGNKPQDYTQEDVEVASYLADVAWEIVVRKLMEEELRKSRDELEMRVHERTAELTQTLARLELVNQELQEFASVASHDLQEPLRKIQTFCNMLQARCTPALDNAGRKYLERVLNSAGRMRQLLDDLLLFSRVTARPGPANELELGKIVREAADVFEERIKEAGGLVEIANMPKIEADETQMLRLFQNLIGNALKFRSDENPRIKVYARQDGKGSCEIFVKDNGIGFDQQFEELMFKPFQRLHGRGKYEGTGMGLAICRKIVERHGGTIRAESAPGKGSRFIIRLPVRDTAGGRASIGG